MATDSVQQSNGGTIIPQLLLTPTVAVAGAKFVGRKTEAKDLLKAEKFDSFELKDKKFDDLKPEEKTAYANLKTEFEAAKKNKETAEAAAKEVFGDNAEITTEEYAKKQGYASVEDLVGDKDGKGGKYEAAKAKVENVNAQIKTAEDELAKAADEAAKKPITDKIAALKDNDLKAAQAEVDKITPHYNLVKEAKEGKVAKEAFTTKKLSTLVDESTKALTKELTPIVEKLPKQLSMIKGAIGAAAGLVVGIIIAKLISPSTPEA